MNRFRIGLVVVALLGCGTEPETVGERVDERRVHVLPEHRFPHRPAELEGATVAWVRVATTPEQRRRGLMFEEKLEPDRGMLFIYPDARVLRFWMKDTYIPLSICFADGFGRIVRITEMEPASADEVPPRYHESGRFAIYALEMNRGWFARMGIGEGDHLILDPEIEARAVR